MIYKKLKQRTKKKSAINCASQHFFTLQLSQQLQGMEGILQGICCPLVPYWKA